MGALKHAGRLLNAGQPLGQVFRTLDVSEAIYYRWGQQYRGMKAEEAKRLKELEIEKARKTKLLADPLLAINILRAAMDPN